MQKSTKSLLAGAIGLIAISTVTQAAPQLPVMAVPSAAMAERATLGTALFAGMGLNGQPALHFSPARTSHVDAVGNWNMAGFEGLGGGFAPVRG